MPASLLLDADEVERQRPSPADRRFNSICQPCVCSDIYGYSQNSVFVAHRDTFFRHLDELREGDEVDLRRQCELYRLEVIRRRVVEPTDLSALQQSPSTQPTLITCYPASRERNKTTNDGPCPNSNTQASADDKQQP